MNPGPFIRKLFGPYEHEITEVYRSVFVNLDDFADLVHLWVPRAERILEVGCGEGAMTERIVRKYPTASVLAIDITPRAGRLYRGDQANVRFSRERVEDVATRSPASFDLVLVADVLHHVPLSGRESLLSAIDQAMAPGASLVVKDWVVSASPIHWLCHACDRYLTGDDVHYFPAGGISALVAETFDATAVRKTGFVRPWKNNLAVLVQPDRQLSPKA